MTDSYRGGYKKALSDVLNVLDKKDNIVFDYHCKSKKQYQTAVISLLRVLLSSPGDLDDFMDGTYVFRFNPETKEYVPTKG